VLKNLHTGVVVHAPDTRIVLCNPRAAQLLGLTVAQMLGKAAIDPAWHFLDALGQPIEPAQYPVNTVLTTGRALNETDFGVVASQQSETTWLSVSAFPEFDAAGQIERVVVNFHDISIRRRAQSDLERTRAFALAVLDGLSSQVCVLDASGDIVAVNRAWKDFHIANGGHAETVHEGMNYLRAVGAPMAGTSPSVAPTAPTFSELLREVLDGQRDHFEWEYACHSPTEKRWFMARVSRMHHVHPLRVVVAHDNVTTTKLAQEHLRDALSFSQKLIESMQDGFSVLDREGRAVQANPALCRMTGFSAAELVGEVAPFPYWPPEEYEHIQAAFYKTLASEGGDFELTFMRKNGERFAVSVAASAVLDAHGQPTGYTATVKDITALKRMEREIERLAFRDPLTNLPNRRLFDDRLNRAQAVATRSGRHGAVMMIDLDTFKLINDTHGHHAGDLLLVQAARRLEHCVRDVDTVARLGGDEFVVIIDELSWGDSQSGEQAQAIAEKIRAALAQPYHLLIDCESGTEAIEQACSASIGVATFASSGLRAAAALRLADRAMYDAKQSGGNQVRFAKA
jgi:diguanylate cyclase (GGDEF)-like protein/PAS domain S-box-containing protein